MDHGRALINSCSFPRPGTRNPSCSSWRSVLTRCWHRGLLVTASADRLHRIHVSSGSAVLFANFAEPWREARQARVRTCAPDVVPTSASAPDPPFGCVLADLRGAAINR
jgi:hypothetical protein